MALKQSYPESMGSTVPTAGPIARRITIGKKNKAPQTITQPAVASVPMTPQMMNSIKASPKGVMPAGLAKYMAMKKASKGKK